MDDRIRARTSQEVRTINSSVLYDVVTDEELMTPAAEDCFEARMKVKEELP